MVVLGRTQHSLRRGLPCGSLRCSQASPDSQQRRRSHLDTDFACPLRGSPFPYCLRLPQGTLSTIGLPSIFKYISQMLDFLKEPQVIETRKFPKKKVMR